MFFYHGVAGFRKRAPCSAAGFRAHLEITPEGHAIVAGTWSKTRLFHPGSADELSLSAVDALYDGVYHTAKDPFWSSIKSDGKAVWTHRGHGHPDLNAS